MTDAQRILLDMKTTLDRHFGLVGPANVQGTMTESPVKPEHRMSPETAARFADLMKEDAEPVKEDVRRPTLDERIARIEKLLGLS